MPHYEMTDLLDLVLEEGCELYRFAHSGQLLAK